MKKLLAIIPAFCLVMLTGCFFDGGNDVKDTAGQNAGTAAQTSGQTGTGTAVDSSTLNADSKGTDKTSSTNDSTASQNKNSTKLRLVVFYQDAEGAIVPVVRAVEKQDGIAKAVVNEMIDSQANREKLSGYGLLPVLPEGTKVLGMDIKNGNAVIDFNSKLLEYKGETAEKSIVSSLVFTLTEFSTIKSVKIIVDGKEQKKLKYGTDISLPLDRKNTLINSESVNLYDGLKKIDVYLTKSVDSKHTYLLPVSLQYTSFNEEDTVEKAVEFLTGEYGDLKFHSEIPSGTSLLGSVKKGSVLTLNLSKEFINYEGASREATILDQLLLTMKQLNGVEKVGIQVDGKNTKLPGGTDISKELQMPGQINALIE